MWNQPDPSTVRSAGPGIPTPSNGRIYGVNPESGGEMTLDQGAGTGQFTINPNTINPECSWR
jgi:hypothetical protein